MRRSIFLLLLILSSLPLAAADYYLSNNGNDSNTGTSENSPWQSLEKLSAELGGPTGTWGSISSGDRVFFRRGDVFRGTIAFSAYNNNGVIFDAYGVGDAPVIKGSVELTGWTLHSGQIWKTTLTQRVYFLYNNGGLQTLARFPNTGTWPSSNATTTALSSSQIADSGIDLIGANVCIREYDWRLNRQVVSGQSGNSITWSSAIEGTPPTGANFYFDNKLAFLDTIGEWFWDEGSNTLYYMSDSSDPNTLNLEASVALMGIAGNDNRSDNLIQNLRFEHFASEAIRLMGASNNNVIQSCSFGHNAQAIFLSGNAAQIEGNTIADSYYQAVVLANMANSTFSDNTISRSGIIYGLQRPDFTGPFYSGAIWLINGSGGSTISDNTIEDVGNMGIRFNGTGITIARNIITRAMINMDDGGAIYTWGGNNSSYGNSIQQNIISDMTGSHNGMAAGNIINGIYIDNYSYGIAIEGNTVSNIPQGSGIIINAGAHSCTVTDNVVYGCLRGLGFYDWLPGQSIYDNSVSGNTLYANVEGAFPIEIASDDNNYGVMASSDSNYLVNPHGGAVVNYLWSSAQTFSMAQWRIATGHDAASIESYDIWPTTEDYSFILINPTDAAVLHSFSASSTKDLDNQIVSNATLAPFSSQIFIDAAALPIELLSFGADTTPAGQVLLFWETASEVNVDNFDVQKSTSGQDFNTIASIAAQNKPAAYSVLDAEWSPVAYYRLKINDLDGAIAFSDMIVVERRGEAAGLTVYPNPVAAGQPVQVYNPAQEAWMGIFDASGALIQSHRIGQGLNQVQLGILPANVYTLRTKTATVQLLVRGRQ